MKKKLLLITMILAGIMVHAQPFKWAKQFSSTSLNYGITMAKYPSGEMIVSGGFEGTVDFDPGEDTHFLTSFGAKDVYVAKIDVEGNLLWVKQIGGTGDDFPRNVSCDASGNIYITGVFEGTADMDPGEATVNFTSIGGKDVFIAELNGNGDYIWAGQLGGVNDGTGTRVMVAPSGNIYISGYYIGTFDFDPGPAEFYMSTNGQSIFVEKLNSNHEFVWAKTMGSTLFDYCQSMCLDEEENVYTIGSFKGEGDFDPGDGTVLFTVFGGNDIFVSKLNSNGNYVWAKHMGGTSDEFGQSIVYDYEGHLYITGNFMGAVDFAPDDGGMILTSFGGRDEFTGKMDTEGNLLWVNQIGGEGDQSSYAMALDNNNNVYVTGYFTETADFDPGEGTYWMTSAGDLDAFVSKLSSNGTFIWAAGMGGPLYDRGMSVISDQGNVYTVGYFGGTADFDPGIENYLLTALGERATFISKLGAELVGVAEDMVYDGITVYPNPMNEDFHIDFNDLHQHIVVNIYNMQGQVVLHQEYLNTNRITVSLKDAPGLYFVQVATDADQTEWIKIIKK